MVTTHLPPARLPCWPSKQLWQVSYPQALCQPGWSGRASWIAERELSVFQTQAWPQEAAGSPEIGDISTPRLHLGLLCVGLKQKMSC